MPPKGTSEEEKKIKLLNYMLETGNIYNNSTIETASKATGISAMIIKNIVVSLADEGLVDSEKIGASTYYWIFKSKKSQQLIQQFQQLQDENKELTSQEKILQDSVAQLKQQKQKSEQTDTLINQKKSLNKQLQQLQESLNNFQKYSYEQYEELKSAQETVKQQANLETDNIFALRRYLTTKFNMERSTANKQLGIDQQFDYVE
ncbi:Mnd1 [Hexamita inflata]|uniref:Mnd1 n=1 Tax=Hexamita inflata TaxID=28002 RepID=A0AA86UHW2_9EUKA|nr:Mnd1 [Hexamita inflata]